MRFQTAERPVNHVAMDQAIVDSGLAPDQVSNERTGIVMGSRQTLHPRHRRGGGSRANERPQTRWPIRRAEIHVLDRVCDAVDLVQNKGPRLLHFLRLRHVQIIVSAQPLSTSSAERAETGCFAGGCEELDWTLSGALRRDGGNVFRKYNNTPSRASRAYDKNRDGFVISGGARVLVYRGI